MENYHQACLIQFLMGLNESFTQVRGQILLMDPMLHMDRVFSLLRQEERQISIGQLHVPHVESTALLCKSESVRSTSSKQNFQKRDKPTCTHCGFVGYTVDKCYKVHGYPLGYRTKEKGPMANQVSHNTPGSNAMTVNEEISPFQLSQLQAQCQQILALLNTKPLPSNTAETSNPNVTYQALANIASSSSLLVHSMSGSFLYKSLCLPNNFTPNLSHSVFVFNVKFPKAVNENLWIIDTGATDHMVHSLSCLTTITSVVNASVELPNGVLVSITHIGTVQVSHSITLTNVLCVPSFQLNLISVSKFVHSLSCCLIFIVNYCLIQAFTPWRMIGLGKLHNGLYLL